MPSTKKLDQKLLQLTKNGPHLGIGSPMYLCKYDELLSIDPKSVAHCSVPKGFHMLVVPFAVARDESHLSSPLTRLRDHLIELGWTPPNRKEVFVKE